MPAEASQPQNQTSTDANDLWVDMMSTLDSAMREAERIKNEVTSEINIDRNQIYQWGERIKSAFNCQAPGTATLSAEQIVVEHAVEQVKASLNCANPDTSDLHSQEVVFDRNPVPPRDDWNQEQGREPQTTQNQAEAGAFSAKRPTAEEQQAKQEPLLDLLDTEASPLQPQPPVDLLDMAQTVPPPQPDLLSMDSQPQAGHPANAPLDLFDAAPAGASAGSAPHATSAANDLPDLL